jgi:hypothetical protein
MVTSEDLAPVLDLVATVADVDAALDAVAAIRTMDLSDDDRARADAAVTALLDDPRFVGRRAELFRDVSHVPAAAERIAAVARDDASPDQRGALAALAERDPGTWADPYARWLLAHDPGPAEALVTLPLDRTSLTPDDIAPLLPGEDGVFAAVALAKLGAVDALLGVLDAICRDEWPPLLYGNPFDAYDRLAAAQPMPSAVTDALLARLPTGTYQADLVVWALTGAADAQGRLLLDQVASVPEPAADPYEAVAVARRIDDGGLAATMELGVSDLAPLRAATPETSARLLERLVREALRAGGDDAMAAGNALMRVVSCLPSPIPLRVDVVLDAWRAHDVLPHDQVGAALGLAGEQRLLAAIGTALRDGDTAAARLLRVALDVRGTAPVHGAGPAPRRRTLGMTRAKPPEPAYAGAEAGGGAGAGDAAPQEPVAVGEEPGTPVAPPPRRLQGEVLGADGTRRENAFAPGATHTLSLWFGPGGEGPLVAQEALDESALHKAADGSATLLVAVVGTEGVTRVDPQQHEITLPPSGATEPQAFAVDVAPDATRVTLNVLVYHERKVIQTIDVVGPVAVDDVPVGGLGIGFPRRTESAPVRGTEIDVSFAFHVGGAGDVLVHDGTARQVTIDGLASFRDDVVALLQDAINGNDPDPGAGTPGDDTQVALLRDLAGLGNDLWEMRLSKVLKGVRPEHAVQVTTDGDDVVPLELVYDRGVPTKDAVLCDGWQDALRTGTCAPCATLSGPTATVCPLGFWGVRLVIERQAASSLDDESSPGSLAAGRAVLRDVDRVLFAASGKVDNLATDATKATVDLIGGLLADRLASVTTWHDWTEKVATHRPGLLLALPHNEKDGSANALQIGDGDVRRIREMTRADVLPPGADVGPVVLLLGCNTANEEISWQSAVAKFRALGAAVVVGTLVETLGRQTAPAARLLATMLWGDDRVDGETIGEVVRALRRRVLLKGWTLGMSLVAYGDADWRLRP